MKEIAEVRFGCGRSYLRVAGYIVAVQGDPVRDMNIAERCWTTEALRCLASKINEAAE